MLKAPGRDFPVAIRKFRSPPSMELFRSSWRDAFTPICVHLHYRIREFVSDFLTVQLESETIHLQALYGALAELARHPEYIQPLREEIETTLARYGATIPGCDQMILLDSFLKECQRLHPPAAGMST
jgi:hypothetical protein